MIETGWECEAEKGFICCSFVNHDHYTIFKADEAALSEKEGSIYMLERV